VHNNWANNLKANFYDPGPETLGVEFVGTSVTSGGDGADTSAGNEAVVEENPHIEFFNGQRGHVRCTLMPQEYLADYRIVPYVKQPDAQIFTLGRPSSPKPATPSCNGWTRRPFPRARRRSSRWIHSVDGPRRRRLVPDAASDRNCREGGGHDTLPLSYGHFVPVSVS